MPVITPLYAAVAALMPISLSVRVIGMRRRRRVSIGDGEDEILARRIRAQGNFIEYVPMALVLLLLLELGGASAWLLHGLGIALLVGRLVHAWSLAAHNGTGRIIGMGLTFGVLVVAAIGNLEAALGVAFFG
jgi:uncharacterized membrane protein YecN with MAPEG domain